MSNLTNKPVPFRTLSRDVLLMEKYHQTTYTRKATSIIWIPQVTVAG